MREWAVMAERAIDRLVVGAACLILALGACSAPASTPRHAEFALGMTRAAVVERFGPPLQRRTLRKTSDAVWGPIEDFWPEVPAGSPVEIWVYDSRAEMAAESGEVVAGTTELYFVDGSQAVDGLGFAMAGAVYEAGPSRRRAQ